MAETHKIELFAYTAGLLDGEGSIGIYRVADKRSKISNLGVYRYRIVVCIISTNYAVLTLLKDKFDGKIYKHTVGLGKKLCWTWQINGSKEACKFLKKVFPYLIIKKNQAEMVLKFGKTLVASQYEMTNKIRETRNAIFNQIREVN